MIEFIAVIFTLLSVWFTIKLNVINWPIGIVGIFMYLIIFKQQHLYGQAILQLIFILQSVYGWINWDKTDTKVKTISSEAEDINLGVSIVIGMFLTSYFTIYTDNPQPFLDAFTTVFSVLATWYTTKKIITAWYIWIITDLLFIYMFVGQSLYMSALLYFIFMLLALKGLQQWKKDLKTV